MCVCVRAYVHRTWLPLIKAAIASHGQQQTRLMRERMRWSLGKGGAFSLSGGLSLRGYEGDRKGRMEYDTTHLVKSPPPPLKYAVKVIAYIEMKLTNNGIYEY